MSLFPRLSAKPEVKDDIRRSIEGFSCRRIAIRGPSLYFPLDKISYPSIIEEYDSFKSSNVTEPLVGDYLFFTGWEISIIESK